METKKREKLLEVKHLKKYFNTPRGKLHAVDDVSFTIYKGETLGVVGESGCGKSTLGRTLIRLLDATDGEVNFRGTNILELKDLTDVRRNMQMIFQDPYASLDPRMTVGEIIEEPIVIHKLAHGTEAIDERLFDLMDTVGLARRFVNSYPHELDGGRRQRIGVARALSLDPEFIVCDEPVSALDVSIQAQILNLLQDLQEEKNLTFVFITHDLSVVKHISNNILVMYLGQTVELCETEELFEYPLHPYTKALLSAIPEPTLHSTRERILMKGELTSPIDPTPGCRFAARCLYAKERCFKETPQIEEIRPGHMLACHYAREINNLEEKK